MSSDDATRVRDHWYWRPGWSVGRRFYTWHITFADQPEVAAMATAYADTLAGIPAVDPIPVQWLHLTMQGLGFIDEVDKSDVDHIVEAARGRCAALQPLDLRIGAPHVDPESIQIAVQPADQVRQLRLAIRAAIADVWGADNIPEAETPFNPHMSLGYTNQDADATPLAQALTLAPHVQATAVVRECQLIVLHRDNRMYEWEPYASVQIGSGA